MIMAITENALLIVKELGNLEKLVAKGQFVEGRIYFENDTILVNLLLFSRWRKTNHYLFCVARNKNSSMTIYRPSDIVGYRINDIDYISHSNESESFFLKQTHVGKVNLYEKQPTPSDQQFLFYLKFDYKSGFYIINPFKENVTQYDLSGKSRKVKTCFTTSGIPQKFLAFVRSYLGDCERVVNMVNSEFFSIYNLPDIIGVYNQCDR